MGSSTPAGAPARKLRRSPEEHRQLLTHHMSRLRAKKSEIDTILAELKPLREEFTGLVNEAKAELGKGYTRKHLVVLLEDTSTRLRNLLEEEERRARDREALGLPVYGLQSDLFDTAEAAKLPEEVREDRFWEMQGFLLGREGKINQIPDGCPPRFQQTVLRAAEKGQEMTLSDVQAAMDLRQRQSEPDAGAEPVNLAEPEPGTPEAEAAEDAAIERAKESLDAMGDGAEGAEPFEAQPAELAAQKPRAAVKDRKAGATSGAKTPEAVH
jgi:hypothetical protein